MFQLSSSAVARILNVSPETVTKMARNDDIAAVRVPHPGRRGFKYLFDADQVGAFKQTYKNRLAKHKANGNGHAKPHTNGKIVAVAPVRMRTRIDVLEAKIDSIIAILETSL